MNTDILRGKWTQIKGQVKQRWSKLTDDDIKYMEGNLQEAAGRLQERYGYAREQAEREWDEFVASATNANPAAGRQNDNPTARQNEPGRQSADANANRNQGAARPANPNPNPNVNRDTGRNEGVNQQGV
jgi:uncharacterized protein YjbJ (UPF0337 family)